MRLKILSISSILLALAGLAYSLAAKDHNFSQDQCKICHTSAQFSKYNITESLTQSCKTCHRNILKEAYMHPVDTRPKHVKIPIDFPLSNSGNITCATCHDIHSSPITNLGRKSHYLRRQEEGKTFCDICHLNSPAMANNHVPVFNSAHFTSKFISNDFDNKIDAMSKNCISCHDGSVGKAVVLKSRSSQNQGGFLKFDKGSMHPIGMSYEKSRRRTHKSALKPIELVDQRIRFFGKDKKVGCGSCHDPYSAAKYKLVINNTRSKLCLSCHGMGE